MCIGLFHSHAELCLKCALGAYIQAASGRAMNTRARSGDDYLSQRGLGWRGEARLDESTRMKQRGLPIHYANNSDAFLRIKSSAEEADFVALPMFQCTETNLRGHCNVVRNAASELVGDSK